VDKKFKKKITSIGKTRAQKITLYAKWR